MVQIVFHHFGRFKGQWVTMADADADAFIAANMATVNGGSMVSDDVIRTIQATVPDQALTDTWIAKIETPGYDVYSDVPPPPEVPGGTTKPGPK